MNSYFNVSLNAVSQFSNFVDLLNFRAQTQPEQRAYTFLRYGEIASDTLTYKELDHKARAIAIYLQLLASVGERVLLLYPPGLEFHDCFSRMFICRSGGGSGVSTAS